MKWIEVKTEGLAEHGLLPLPEWRRKKDGSAYLIHEDWVARLGYDLGEATGYNHNSPELEALLGSDDWKGGGEDEPGTSADYATAGAVKNLLVTTRAGIQTMSLTDAEALSVRELFPRWEDVIGESLSEGMKLQYGGKLYKVIQAHTAQEDWLPDATGALYGLVSSTTSEHAGTLEDPIPYVPKMVLYAGLYYSEDGVTYLCRTNSIVGYDVTLASGSLDALVERVEKDGL